VQVKSGTAATDASSIGRESGVIDAINAPTVEPGKACPARKWHSPGDLPVFGASGGVCVFVDQAVEDTFSADLLHVDVSYGAAVSVTFVAGDALSDALWGARTRPLALTWASMRLARIR